MRRSQDPQLPPRAGQYNRPVTSCQGNLLTQAAGAAKLKTSWLGHGQSQNVFTIISSRVVLTRGPLYTFVFFHHFIDTGIHLGNQFLNEIVMLTDNFDASLLLVRNGVAFNGLQNFLSLLFEGALYQDSLSGENSERDQYSLIMANPPFTGSVFQEEINKDLLGLCKTRKTELLFVALFTKMLRVGGRCACIVPDGVLFGSSKAHQAIRHELVENQQLQAVISMPSGVFKPYAGVSTAILIFTKTNAGGTENVWFYDMKADGYSLDDKRSEIKGNDIPDIIARFHNRDAEADRERTEQSFFVPKQKIVDNRYDLSINKYKKTEYKPVEYPPTSEIMAEIRELEMKIGEEMAKLEEMLGL